jgi:hypothetical protein
MRGTSRRWEGSRFAPLASLQARETGESLLAVNGSEVIRETVELYTICLCVDVRVCAMKQVPTRYSVIGDKDVLRDAFLCHMSDDKVLYGDEQQVHVRD